MTDATNPVDWVEKARQDARSARRVLLDPPELSDVTYHVHQAVEKAAKSFLVEEGIKYPRGKGGGHDLAALASLIPASEALHAQALRLADLTPWATSFRYPADDPLTAFTLPLKSEVERRLDEVEAFVEAVAARVIPRSGPGIP